MHTPNKTVTNIFVVIIFLVVFGAGVGLGEWFFREDQHPDYNRLVKENVTLDSLYTIEKEKSQKLTVEIDSLHTAYSNEKVNIANLKDKRDESIRSIDTMGTNSLYKFFSNH